ncbi:ATP-binding cassette multidrug transporter PDR12 [Sugiyamaella lignohabitans]|uniref:ATP-binding cassette multidrug transporter PDR12 n=1 Tax=Sugiyamaella lignohabitans TaxID=796027 RepID=A0A167G036_9ASCO|nr:ATP-binding cassette multidrug transporter PDR12 [Sugiyamaella lignohabitans]ANB15926.1 ATP-binding cassette multidrug transporter PDR12 [Sugiyamaella lignohabitans]
MVFRSDGVDPAGKNHPGMDEIDLAKAMECPGVLERLENYFQEVGYKRDRAGNTTGPDLSGSGSATVGAGLGAGPGAHTRASAGAGPGPDSGPGAGSPAPSVTRITTRDSSGTATGKPETSAGSSKTSDTVDSVGKGKPLPSEFNADENLEVLLRALGQSGNGPFPRNATQEDMYHPAVSFKDLVVKGRPSEPGPIPTVFELGKKILLFPVSVFKLFAKKEYPTILHGLDGIVYPGEMLLVLGANNAGCSTLLKTLSGHINDYSLVDGSVCYDSMTLDSLRRSSYRSQVIYNSSSKYTFDCQKFIIWWPIFVYILYSYSQV